MNLKYGQIAGYDLNRNLLRGFLIVIYINLAHRFWMTVSCAPHDRRYNA